MIIKKNLLMRLFICISFFVSCVEVNASINQTAYYCPTVNDLKYEDFGQITANITVNGLSTSWYGHHGISSDYSPAITFSGVNLKSGGYGHPYQVECRYTDQAQNFIWVYVSNYAASDVIGSNWDGNENDSSRHCNASDPSNCQYYLEKR